ncbi:expressed unknown protein [Seminavis robusta]|uniref:Uncharacterized protein n=1 Tax=Seminavis robusta TaxID=568900 RepID=A0A9N8EJ64_9STRA|nr:expressed unknown protein [Seminavis robusta]|eukprot:Sro1186_g250380.1 n/a (68) ;mRNA; r:26755-27050
MKTKLLWNTLALWASASTVVNAEDDYDDFGLSDSSEDDDSAVVKLTEADFFEKTVNKRVFLKFYDPM